MSGIPAFRRPPGPPCARRRRRLPAAGLVAALLLGAALAGSAAAADAPPRPLAHADADAWRSIASPALSGDGRWLAYAFMPLEGDGEVVVRHLDSAREFRVPVGSLPPPPLAAAEHNPERPAPRREVALSFTSDSRFLVATRFPSAAARRAARIDASLPAPDEGLVVVTLATAAVREVIPARSLAVPARGGPLIAYLQTRSSPAPAAASGSPATDLVVRHLRERRDDLEFRHAGVSEFLLSRDGAVLLAITAAPARVLEIDPAAANPRRILADGAAEYRRLAWDRTQRRAAFLASGAPTPAPRPWSLHVWRRGDATAPVAVPPAPTGGLPGYVVSGDHTPLFSFDGNHLQVFTAPPVEGPPAESPADPEERVSADIWHWRDETLLPMQRQRAPRDRTRAYATLVALSDGSVWPLADPSLSETVLSPTAAMALGRDDRAYRRSLDYEGPFHDLHLLDPRTGRRQRIRDRLDGSAGTQWSPDGRWIAFYADRQWFAVEAASGTAVPLTASVPVPVHLEDADHPKHPASHGAAGWSTDGRSFLVYDRYDLWQTFPDGSAAVNLTRGAGRADGTVLRLQPLAPRDPDDPRLGVDLSETLILRGERERDRASGFLRLRPGALPERLHWETGFVQYVGRSADAPRVLFTASRFDRFPDLHVAGLDFSGPRRVSDGDAQRARFAWGRSELRPFRSVHGEPLTAALVLPAGFDPAKKYPLIVYLYERLSQTVHWFIPPVPVPGTTINPSFYASNGYAVLMPDISYRVGEPGESALACVLPAIDEVVREGWVDESALGIQGHSWGGYQTAYLITRTARFRAAAAGAAVGNMTSAYAGVSSGSGRSRQYKYESEQSRIGAPPYERPLEYLANSPVFAADRVVTPMLLLHNDGDDTVPFGQGIELFLTLRRAGKEVYLINYHHEFHGLRRRADQKDYFRRMHQFFDHHLKGSPRPEWMERGVPFLDAEAEKGRFRTNP